MTKLKQVVRHFCKCIKNEKQKYLIYISIQTLCYETRSWAQVHPLFIDHHLDVSTNWLSPPVVNSIDWTWFWKAHTFLYKVPKLSHMRSKELSVELWDRIVTRNKSGEAYKKILQHWRSPRTQLSPSFLNGKSLEQPILFLVLAAWPNWAIGEEGPWSGGWSRP